MYIQYVWLVQLYMPIQYMPIQQEGSEVNIAIFPCSQICPQCVLPNIVALGRNTRAKPLQRRPCWQHNTWVISHVPIEHHPTIRYMVYNGYYKVMSNIPKSWDIYQPLQHVLDVVQIVRSISIELSKFSRLAEGLAFVATLSFRFYPSLAFRQMMTSLGFESFWSHSWSVHQAGEASLTFPNGTKAVSRWLQAMYNRSRGIYQTPCHSGTCH